MPQHEKKGRRGGSSSGRKQCELGSSCPYKNEFQHTSEFSHDKAAPPNISSFGGSGNKLGGGPQMPRSPKKVLRKQLDDKPVKKRKMDTTEITACCDACGTFVPLSSFDAHMRTHEVSSVIAPHPSTALMREQDREYEASLEADILRLSRETYEAEQTQQLRNSSGYTALSMNNEDAEIRRALELSLQTSIAQSNIRPVIDLTDTPPAIARKCQRLLTPPEPSPEPSSGELVMLRFKVTSDGKTSKLQRSFRLLSTLQSVYAYVKSELQREDVTVQPVVGGTWNIASDREKTLQDLGVQTNTTLVVRTVA